MYSIRKWASKVTLFSSDKVQPALFDCDEVSSSIEFQHTPLYQPSKQLRLLKVTRVGTESIRFDLEILRTYHCPSYIALSYTWGPELPTFPVRINGSPFRVRENLYWFLNHLEKDMFPIDELRIQKHCSVYLWVDQICIDQASSSEKSEQVKHMHETFTRAKFVIAWLGTPDHTVDEGIDLIHTLVDISDDQIRLQMLSARNKSLVKSIFQRPYWTRLWILQEFLLAQNVFIVCGQRVLRYETLQYFLVALHGGIKNPTASILGPATQTVARMMEFHGGLLAQGLRGLTLRALLLSFSHLECFDPRDKIYGLLGLCSQKVEVDYDRPVVGVFSDAMGRMNFDMVPDREKQRFLQLAISMGIAEDDEALLVLR